METKQLHDLFLQHPIICTDSRECQKDALFFALKGEHFDGNRYAAKAIESGCAYAIIDEPEYQITDRTILVEDVLKALQQLARYHRESLDIPVIGITGTNGKTTTKELVSAVLGTTYSIEYTKGNLNNSIGVPLSVLKITDRHQMAVIEMGASHPGDIRELVEIARPDFALITNIGTAHLEGFGNYRNVIRTKGELYDFLRENGGVIFIHHEDPVLNEIAFDLPQITYGTSPEDTVCGKTAVCDPFLSFFWMDDEITLIKTHLIGSYNLMNALAAIAVGKYFHVPKEKIVAAIESYVPQNNRSEMYRTADNTLIIDAYNANPSSMKVALESFRDLRSDHKAIILGDMKELGPTSPELHREVFEMAKEMGFETMIFCGPEFAKVAGGCCPAFLTTDELKEYLTQHPMKGYHILLKASHSMNFESLKELL